MPDFLVERHNNKPSHFFSIFLFFGPHFSILEFFFLSFWTAQMVDGPVKVVVVGDQGAGKTCLLIAYTTNAFPTDYIPKVFDNYSSRLPGAVLLSLWDTASEEIYDRLRPLSYPGTTVILCCHSVVEPSTVENIRTRWIPELRHHCPQVPIILVGTKTDLRSDPEVVARLAEKGVQPLTPELGDRLVREFGAASYLETSALLRSGLKVLFDRVFELAKSSSSSIFSSNTSQSKFCSLL